MISVTDWTGRVGDAWADEWRRTDRAFIGIAQQLDAAILSAAPDVGQAIDLGCGAGSTTLALARARPRLDITGIDLSAALIAVARRRAEGITNARFVTGDAMTALPPNSADLIVSRHGVMFFADPVAGFTSLRAAAKPGARLVFSCFRHRTENEWARIADAALGDEPTAARSYEPGPFRLADQRLTADILTQAGWTDLAAASIDVDYLVGEGDDPVSDALAFFARIGPAASTLSAADPDRRAAIMASLRNALEARRDGQRVTLQAAAWIWTASAGEPA